MISSLSRVQQHTSACGKCHSRSISQFIAPAAALRCRAVRLTSQNAGNSAMHALKLSSEPFADTKQQQDGQGAITPTSNQPAHHCQAFLELLTSNTSLLAFAVLMLYLVPTDPAAADSMHQHPTSLFDLAEGEEGIVSNMVKYARYFVTVLLGTGYVMVQPLVAAFKKPVTAVVAIVGIVGGAYLLKFTLDAMLGIQEPFSYEAGSIVPYS